MSNAIAKGTFSVNLKPLEAYNQAFEAKLGRLSIDKQFQGDLAATSQGEMLSAGTSIENSAGYVAIEHVTGTLQGRAGSFTLQHNANMNRGVPSLLITVVPDSATGDLTGLTGQMTINIVEGQHFYEFNYTLP